ncbi:MAG: GNAT family N-acetyltransferase [Ruminococcaceae bacterium]|nr:GNAT family N-acetyltransferase [Oscillospiraceae bacterium]
MFRPATKEETEKIIRFYDIVIEAMDRSAIHLKWQKNIHPSHLLLRTSVDQGELFVYEENGEILCACIMNQCSNEAYSQIFCDDSACDKIGIIHVFATYPKCVRQGLGEKFLQSLLQYAGAHLFQSVRLDVLQFNLPAICLYEKLGFVRRGEMQMFVPNIGTEDFYFYEYKTSNIKGSTCGGTGADTCTNEK